MFKGAWGQILILATAEVGPFHKSLNIRGMYSINI